MTSGDEGTVLYRCPVPTDYLCSCGKVARELRKAGIEVTQVRVPLRKARRDDVVELSGQRVVPLLVSGGRAVCDSKRILEWIPELADADE